MVFVNFLVTSTVFASAAQKLPTNIRYLKNKFRTKMCYGILKTSSDGPQGMQQQALVAVDAAVLAVLAPYAGPRREPERSPPRGDRRPLATRNRSRERRAAAGGDNSYGQLREKAMNERSKCPPTSSSTSATRPGGRAQCSQGTKRR